MKFETTGGRLFLGYLVLSLLPPIPMIVFSVAMMGLYGKNNSQYGFQTLVAVMAGSWVVMSLLLCLIIFGPMWFVMHKLGKRKRWHAFVAAFFAMGLGLTLVVLPQVLSGESTADLTIGSLAPMVLSGLVQAALYGLVAAFIAWRIAYRRVPVEGA